MIWSCSLVLTWLLSFVTSGLVGSLGATLRGERDHFLSESKGGGRLTRSPKLSAMKRVITFTSHWRQNSGFSRRRMRRNACSRPRKDWRKGDQQSLYTSQWEAGALTKGTGLVCRLPKHSPVLQQWASTPFSWVRRAVVIGGPIVALHCTLQQCALLSRTLEPLPVVVNSVNVRRFLRRNIGNRRET
jgi:hypothetical protein